MTGETSTPEAGEGPSKEIVSRAKEMGWCPKDEWRGNPEQWIDADAFVERGETLMPILKANNRKLVGKVQSLEQQLSETQRIIQANTETIEELKKFNTTSLRQQAKQQKKELASAIAEARREGNVEQELELTEQLSETTRVLKETENQPVRKPKANGQSSPPPESDATQTPEWKEFVSENSWWGKDKRRTNLAMGIAEELREHPDWQNVTGKAFLDEVVRQVNDTMGGGQRQNTSRVEGGAGNGSGSTSSRGGSKGYANLPADAKAACDKQASRLVGEGRAYKTVDEWRKAYAAKYFEE